MDTTGEYDMADLLTLIVTERAEGLSVRPGQAPAVHLSGETHVIEGPCVSPQQAESLLRSLADTRQMRELHERGTVKFLFRFRQSVRFSIEARSEQDEVHFRIDAVPA